MYRFIAILFIIFIASSCAKKEVKYDPVKKVDAYAVYQEAFEAFEKGDYYYAEKKFSEAELNFNSVEYSAKSALMASYSLYGINFYSEALLNLERYLKYGV